jgi:hypothetical protein
MSRLGRRNPRQVNREQGPANRGRSLADRSVACQPIPDPARGRAQRVSRGIGRGAGAPL